LYYQFEPSTIQEHLDHIQAQVADSGFQAVLEVKMIESGSDQKMPAYDLQLIEGDTDTETR
jgi:hypothetical protein